MILIFFFLFAFSPQNEYIKYPVLYELSHKYLQDNQPESNLPDRLEELKEAIRKEIRKELKVRWEGRKKSSSRLTFPYYFCFKIKEGAEKLREVAKDRRALSDVASIVKKSNTKLAELKSELHELESQIILTQGNSNGKGEQNWNSKNFVIFDIRQKFVFSLVEGTPACCVTC